MTLKGVLKLTLRELTKEGGGGINQLSFYASFPELRALRVEGDVSIQSVADFVWRSQAQNLHHLSFQLQDKEADRIYTNVSAHALLDQLAELESLELETSGARKMDVCRGICQQLVEHGPEDLCEKLRTLRISGCRIPSSYLTQLRETRPLLNVTVNVGKPVGMEEAGKIKT
jgi:hypothetical protein